MAKQLVNQRRIYKIQSSRFRLNKWDLVLDDKNTHLDEIVAIGDNQILEFIRQIKGTNLVEEESLINETKKEIKVARKEGKKAQISKLYKKINNTIFIQPLFFISFSVGWI
jgi:hypothetical protein